MDCLSFDLALTNMLKQMDNKVIFLTLCMSPSVTVLLSRPV